MNLLSNTSKAKPIRIGYSLSLSGSVAENTNRQSWPIKYGKKILTPSRSVQMISKPFCKKFN